MTDLSISRRGFLGVGVAGAVLAGRPGAAAAQGSAARPADGPLRGNIRQSVARWTFKALSIDALCDLVKATGFSAIDLVGPQDWPALKRHGVESSMCNGAELNLEDGWADSRFHDELTRRYLDHIDRVAEAGYRNLICFSGNRRGRGDEEGLRDAETGLRRILSRAEERGVVLHMELLNSRVNHPDYLCDRSAWGIELCRRLGSENFKLLYDIYHMQVMEGDIIRSIGENHRYFGHYHTAGNPGRHELGEDQELNYPAICRAILATGFKGYLAQEFIPSPKEPEGAARSLREAVRLCDV